MDDHAPPADRTREHHLAPLRRAPWIIVAVLLVATSWLTWRAYFHKEEGDVITSAMIAFERQNSLTVFSSRFEVVAESTNTPSVGPFDVDLLGSRQAMLVPATVEYRTASTALSRSNSQVAERNAVALARNPEVLALARTAARDAIRQNLAIPLQVAGYGDVSVNVRFDGETSE